MGPVHPQQRKGCLPKYACGKLVELQQKIDELKTMGVFNRLEDIGVSVEHLNPSFLLKAPCKRTHHVGSTSPNIVGIVLALGCSNDHNMLGNVAFTAITRGVCV